MERADAVNGRVGGEAADDAPRALITAPTALGHRGNVRLGEPGRIGDHSVAGLAADLGVLVVGILGVAVVAPDRHLSITARPVRRPSLPAATRRDSGRAGSWRTSGRPGPSGACDRAIRQLVLHGLATVKTRTFGPGGLVDRLALARENRAVRPDQVGATCRPFAAGRRRG